MPVQFVSVRIVPVLLSTGLNRNGIIFNRYEFEEVVKPILHIVHQGLLKFIGRSISLCNQNSPIVYR